MIMRYYVPKASVRGPPPSIEECTERKVKGRGPGKQIAIDGKRQYLGYYATEEEAARAFDAKAAKHGRELNFPDEWEDVEDIEEEEEEEEDHDALRSKGKRKGFSSKYRGVYRHKGKGSRPWEVQIAIDGKRQYLGYYATEEEAARAFDAKAAKHGRELNFPDEWEGTRYFM